MEPTDNCAYPVAPLADAPRLESVESLRAPDCREYQLGEAIELPLEEEARHALSFDVNDDSVADVFFLRSDDGVGLLKSRVSGGRVSYEPASCMLGRAA
jgi:hypothetical protein